ncbi:MOSC domain-containing protein [Luteibacter sp. 3190]|uniref:MOSC domain-containing protein n=1 Tax=Luteibacter sp. 3190 TaxID=2817736 RepID=UPI002862CD05|nr:MOSC domain-containing protein [Luteibacter sp. 3190]MDR6935777.1 MOSC domain-containing protein YiiM [Luteibacter sp. 3190]
MNDAYPIGYVMTGPVAALGDAGAVSAMHKRPVHDAVRITTTGLASDAQADLKVHGGPEKAIHHYPFDHYAAWRAELPARPVLDEPGAFGENLSTQGLVETGVAVGDVFRLGSAVLQVSQGRQPCWKLNLRFDTRDMALRLQQSGRTGWYYRVLEEGDVSPGDRLERIDRVTPAWTIERVWRIFYIDRLDYDALSAMAELPTLAESWRRHARRRLESKSVEDWSKRLTGKDASQA